MELTYLLTQMIKLFGKKPVKTLWRTKSVQWGILNAQRRRTAAMKRGNWAVPMGIGISPTMRCNLECKSCYARFHSSDGEIPLKVLNRVVGEAISMGVFLFVITGGEPYLRPELMEIYRKHKGALFLTVTNGTLINKDLALEIAKYGNIFPVVSIEGTREQTDTRRGDGVYDQVMNCMSHFKASGIPYGYSSVVTSKTYSTLCSEEFIDGMIDMGCTVGFYNELIPYDEDETDLVPTKEQREEFKRKIKSIMDHKPIIMVYLPDDEYDEKGFCRAVKSGAMHINAEGYVEPCPFAHFARENINENSFKEVLESPFLRTIREHPTVLKHGEIGCALVNNHRIMEQVAKETGARSTNI